MQLRVDVVFGHSLMLEEVALLVERPEARGVHQLSHDSTTTTTTMDTMARIGTTAW